LVSEGATLSILIEADSPYTSFRIETFDFEIPTEEGVELQLHHRI
jgi:hypothetical protein